MSENKKLDGRPAYALEKEIVRDEIDECIRTGLGILAGRDQKQIDNFHNTKYLLKQYRKVVYAIHVSEADLMLEWKWSMASLYRPWRLTQNLLELI